MKANKKHKSSVFSTLFNNPDVLRELYSAIEGISIPEDMPIDVNTLTDVLIRGKLNDVSFMIDNRLVVLVEHQSTISDNLPLRFLQYIGKLYERITDYKKRFNEKLIKIPKPEFIVLYNGKKPFPDHKELCLSDAFQDVQGLRKTDTEKLPLELIANVYNINQGHNPQILKKSVTLDNYSVLTSKIREHLKAKIPLEKSLELAIKYCIDNNILIEYLKKYGAEVYSMLYGEYRFEDEAEVIREETWEDAQEASRKEIARNLLIKGLTPEFIHETTGLSLEKIAVL